MDNDFSLQKRGYKSRFKPYYGTIGTRSIVPPSSIAPPPSNKAPPPSLNNVETIAPTESNKNRSISIPTIPAQTPSIPAINSSFITNTAPVFIFKKLVSPTSDKSIILAPVASVEEEKVIVPEKVEEKVVEEEKVEEEEKVVEEEKVEEKVEQKVEEEKVVEQKVEEEKIVEEEKVIEEKKEFIPIEVSVPVQSTLKKNSETLIFSSNEFGFSININLKYKLDNYREIVEIEWPWFTAIDNRVGLEKTILSSKCIPSQYAPKDILNYSIKNNMILRIYTDGTMAFLNLDGTGFKRMRRITIEGEKRSYYL
jgi:hypothetical protein